MPLGRVGTDAECSEAMNLYDGVRMADWISGRLIAKTVWGSGARETCKILMKK